jgi:hypothetical protein
MILRSPAENENPDGLALTVILNAVKGLPYVFDPSKQITSRFFVAEFILRMAEGLLRMTLRLPRETGGKPALLAVALPQRSSDWPGKAQDLPRRVEQDAGIHVTRRSWAEESMDKHDTLTGLHCADFARDIDPG